MNATNIFTKQHEQMSMIYLSFKQTFKGFESQHTQKGYNLPDFTLLELINWAYVQSTADEIFNNWMVSGYNLKDKPKLDFKISSDKRYTLDNLILTTKEISRISYLMNKPQELAHVKLNINNN